MDPVMSLLISGIVAAIILVMLNKQQSSKVSNNIYSDDVQQLYLLTTAEYKINALETKQQLRREKIESKTTALPEIELEIAQLTQAFNEGKIHLNELNSKLDSLLSKFNTDGVELSQVF
ncbi:hypothetical protein [Mucilaginibacter ginsenosidivorax]|uniref:Uncharacterized protein n=1 Tax=Mucilaginibacter ginsenosidivorax TaxID=862126 RepID=A0A5B8W5V5_9SPHI|nr:hypothetical protein [Mucilaginibacter ginsenosidivorax]QEC79071.1 hypothetical protein FSB76_25115 [Mucilaginibacter ginsenosidivorax]